MPKGVYQRTEKNRQPKSAAHRAALSLAAKRRTYGPLSQEHKAAISEGLRGHKCNEKTLAKMRESAYWKGRRPLIPFARGNKLGLGNKHAESHGLSNHPLYHTWCGIIARCTHLTATNYGAYGGRGITIYEPWLDVAIFLRQIEAILGPKPEGYSLDRIDNQGPYAPDNVRWATRKEQSLNSRREKPSKRKKQEILAAIRKDRFSDQIAIRKEDQSAK